MRHFFIPFLTWLVSSLHAVDYDCVFIGTSPIPFFEAIYQASMGAKVLMLESSCEVGGAWQSVNVCDIAHADLGCHQVSNSQELADFYAIYTGCKITSLDHPLEPFDPATSPNGFYFSGGCFELIDHLKKLASSLSIEIELNHPLEELSFNLEEQQVLLRTNNKQITAKKLYVTPNSCFLFDQKPGFPSRGQYYHLYLLISDATSPRFSYRNGENQIARMINLTHFVGLTNSGRQLIVLQTHGDENWDKPQNFLNDLKKEGLVDDNAMLLCSDSRIYEQGGSQFQPYQLSEDHRALVEMLDTAHIANTAQYIERWKQVLRPYREIVHED